MPVSKLIRICFTFYKSFLPASAVITICCLSLFWKYGISILTSVLWLKLLTQALVYQYINRVKWAEYHYYHNLGLSKRRLWIVTLVADFVILVILLIQLSYLR
jgi:hypothetical protein